MNVRLFEILYILLNKERITAKELASHFEVSTRTIYRDIDTIGLAGIPIYTEKGRGGGISLLPDFVLNKAILSEDEQNNILSSLQSFSQLTTNSKSPTLQKLANIFNKTAPVWMDIDFTDWSFQQENYWDTLKKAILASKIVTFNYYSSYSSFTCRNVGPIKLWFKSKNWYLKAYDIDKNDLRIFKINRIKNLNATEQTFEKRDLEEKENNYDKRNNINLKLIIKSTMTHRVLDEFDGLVESVDEEGNYIISANWPEDEWVYSTILSFGEHIEVIEPSYVRDIIRDRAIKMYQLYSEPTSK